MYLSSRHCCHTVFLLFSDESSAGGLLSLASKISALGLRSSALANAVILCRMFCGPYAPGSAYVGSGTSTSFSETTFDSRLRMSTTVPSANIRPPTTKVPTTTPATAPLDRPNSEHLDVDTLSVPMHVVGCALPGPCFDVTVEVRAVCVAVGRLGRDCDRCTPLATCRLNVVEDGRLLCDHACLRNFFLKCVQERA